MPTESPRKTTPIFLMLLMLLAPFASANVTTFSNGDASVDVEIRDGNDLANLVDGSIDLPDGETVTSASMKVSTTMVEHGAHVRIDTDTMPRVWNPDYNNQLTEFSDKALFTYEDGSDATPVSLAAEGFLTDFEGTDGGFADATDPNTMPSSGVAWQHGALTSADTPSSCASGADCWGTNLADSNYTDDHDTDNNGIGEAFQVAMYSAELFVDPLLKDKTAYFDSWHNLETRAGSQANSKRFSDCAYLEIRESPNPGFPPGYNPTDFSYLPIDQTSNGLTFGTNFAQGGGGFSGTNGRIDSACSGLLNGSNPNYGLAGTSTTPQNPSGWITLEVDLTDFIDKYVQIRFVMHHTAHPGMNLDDNMSGWYVDNFRLGDLLPQSASMTVRGMTPSVLGGDNHPNGYGILTLEAETTTSATLSVDVLDTNGNLIYGKDGSAMAGLRGDIIELWNIDTRQYRAVNLKFNFDSGPDRLSTPVLHGFSIGSRVGTGFNYSAFGPSSIDNGVWSTMGGGFPMIYTPDLRLTSFSPPVERSKFSYPITSVTPYIQDDCSESPSIEITPVGSTTPVNVTDGVKSVFAAPMFGFTSVTAYQGPCDVGGIWFDLEFGHHAEHMRIDVADDGDVDYGYLEPAFDMFGRQTTFVSSTVNQVNYAADSATLTLDLNGEASGGVFMLPEGAEVSAADISFDQVSIRSNSDPQEGFKLSLMAGSQSVELGDMPNASVLFPESLTPPMDFKGALNSLLSNPSVAGTHEDAFGRYWVKFRFMVDSPNASSGTTAKLVNLDVVYNYSTTLGSSDGLDIELNQGVALWTGGATATVPVAVYTDTGGGVLLSDLSVSSSTGYANTLTFTDNPVGLYPNGEIYEVVTTHTVDPLTGTSLSEAWLTFESPGGFIKFSWSDFMSFAEASDEHNHVTLESTSSATAITNGHEITWHFRVNPTWDDTDAVRVYAGLTTANNINGLPDAVLFDPAVGNAVENDAGITMFQLQNSIGVEQALTGAESGQDINLIGQVRLQDLNEAPDPSSYYLVLELKHVNTTDGNLTIEWEEVANRSGVIGGDFNWNIDLGNAAGSETYRFAVRGYEGGDLLCPPSEYNPDETCAIPFDITIDTYEPNLLEIQVLSPGTDASVDSNWRTLLDDTWVVPQQAQKIRMSSQDLPNPPATLDLHLWVEHDHDGTNEQPQDGIPQPEEYITVTMTGDGEAPTANYTGEYNDYANQGLEGKVSLWVEGYDLAGNPIDGGAPGFDNDRVTYVSMTSKSPVIRNFFIEDSKGNGFLNSNELQWDGTWNQTMYAGNTYHLILEASDDNGWRDVDFFKINLDKTTDAEGKVQDMNVWYFPRNETAWSDSPHISIVNDGNVAPTMLTMDNTALIDPFEADFILNIPIRINWGVVGLDGKDIEPKLQMQDLDNPLYTMLSGVPGRYIQIWRYSDGMQLDFRTDEANNLMVTPYFEDLSEPYTSDVREGFVYAGDTVRFAGQFAFREGIYDSVYINPEVELTMEIVRQNAAEDFGKGYIATPGETVLHTFTGGVFDINITAPVFTNEYTYTFRLINLPTGAEDFTSALCATSTSYGCGTFELKVDRTPPEVVANTWLAERGALPALDENRPIANVLSTATYHCVDIQVQIKEQEAMFPGDLQVNWMFYSNDINYFPWPEFNQISDGEPMTETLSLTTIAGGYLATATCVDLWPVGEGVFDANPTTTKEQAPLLVFWVSGVDSAGSNVRLGGGPQEDGTVLPIFSSEAKYKSQYTFIHEEATFEVRDVLLDDDPRVGDSMKMQIKVKNTGTMSGVAELVIKSVTDSGTPVVEKIVTSEELGIAEESDWIIVQLEPFAEQTTGMYYTISLNGSSDTIYDGSTSGDVFNVKVAEEEDSSSLLLIVVLLVVVIGVLGTLVFVMARRGGGGGGSMLDDEYEDEDDEEAYSESGKVLAEIPADVDPEMARAMQTFPQWTQAEIQGYFDQGWTVESLQDWVNNQ
ncbi:MAG: hypothetical protein ACPHFV_03290 [Poseidonia sp.]